MTPKEKAQELVNKYLTIEEHFNVDLFCPECGIELAAKYCALIVVDELLDSHWNDRECGIGSKVQFYRMVKSEIKKL
jgi:rubredoxin